MSQGGAKAVWEARAETKQGPRVELAEPAEQKTTEMEQTELKTTTVEWKTSKLVQIKLKTTMSRQKVQG